MPWSRFFAAIPKVNNEAEGFNREGQDKNKAEMGVAYLSQNSTKEQLYNVK